jgi:hypothetical protein
MDLLAAEVDAMLDDDMAIKDETLSPRAPLARRGYTRR